ncbi:MAG: subclass B3 metallo-beta-lactamase [Arcicella sp.]|jgi:metallo-beta-lactamase class B|nr:subclass B3 metallo-beta-lactamase [Arcicella sp.]
MFKKTILGFAIILLAMCNNVLAQTITEPLKPKAWTQYQAPFKIVGNLYYVGTYDLACYLIVTPKGNILINTGLSSSYSQILDNITTLGFKPKQTKILLTTQAHFDHLGALAALKKTTKAQFYVNSPDAQVVADGGKSDYEFAKYGTTFAPVTAEKILMPDEKIIVGGSTVQLLHHPGHTKGSCSYLVDVMENGKTYKVLIANMPSIIVDRKFKDVIEYPSISNDYAETFKKMEAINFDIWLASHASQFEMHEKLKANPKYNPLIFADKTGYLKALGELKKAYDNKLIADEK